MERIGRIGGVWRYPVKSLQGEPLRHARLDKTGIIGDRRWALKSRRTNELVNCKHLTELLTIGASYDTEPEPGYGVAPVRITLPDGRTFLTGDPSASAAISGIAGEPLELWPLLPPTETDHYRLRAPFTPELTKQRMGLRPDDPYPDFSAYEPEMIEELQYFFSPRGSYKDAYPLHYVTSASLRTLESYEPGIDVNPRRFRPNFYIEGVELDGFPELDWHGYDLIIGDVVLNCAQETVRCVMPSQAQMGLAAEPRMGFLLNRVTKLKFGAYCHIRKAGILSVGDEVFLERKPAGEVMHYEVLPLPAGIEKTRENPPPPPKPFYPVRVVEKRTEAEDIVSLGFRMEDGAPAFPYLPGQHLIFKLHPEGQARPLMRSYSITSMPGAGVDYGIAVKRIGAGSRYLQDEVQVGDRLEVRWPSGRFFAVPEIMAPLVLVSNGIGVTPLFNMLQWVARENPARAVHWLHATRHSGTHAFKSRVAELAPQLSDFHRTLVYRHPRAEDREGVDYDRTARFSAPDFAFLERIPDAEIFICGSESFLADIEGLLEQQGVGRERIHVERFFSTVRGAAFLKDGAAVAAPVRVLFRRSGVEVEWRRGDPTLLELAEQAGIPADYGCRFGACMACSTPLLSGEVRYHSDEIVTKPGEALICCAEPVTDCVLDL